MQNRVSFIKFADVKVPVMKELPNKGYVLFGEDNKFPNMLLNMFNKSSKHNGIILGKVNYIVGKGFDQPMPANPYESCNEVLKKVCLDIEVFGGCYIEVQYNQLGKIAAYYHVPYHKVRSSKDNTQFFVKDWDTYKKNEEPKVFAAYNPKQDISLLKNQTQILYYKEYRPGVETYSYPGYMGALNAIQTDIEISKYHLSTITNGMFASKMISFFEGIPTEEEKREIEKGFKSKFTGSENAGNIVLNFGKDPAKRPQMDDLSSTDLDKHFDILSKSIQEEMFSGHQITSPMLFGIKTEGQLGGRSEIRDAYEIFKNTYVNDKQQALEMLFGELTGVEKNIIPVEPIGFEFSEQTLLQIAPKKWLLEKIGIDASQYPEVVEPTAPASVQTTATEQAIVNENLKNLTGRQWQNLTRIIRKFEKGDISQEQAKLLLKSSLGLNDEEINTMLSIDNEVQEFTSHEKDELLLAEFANCGEHRDDYVIMKSMPYHFQLTELDLNLWEKNILIMIRRDRRVTPEVISDVLGLSVSEIQSYIDRLKSRMIIREIDIMVGEDEITERQIIKKYLPEIDKEIKQGPEKPEALKFKILYSYDVKPGLGPSIISTSRDFCRRMVALSESRMWSRADIEAMSRRMGYSVWDRKGGWYGNSKECRHQWTKNIVMLKDK